MKFKGERPPDCMKKEKFQFFYRINIIELLRMQNNNVLEVLVNHHPEENAWYRLRCRLRL